MILFKDKLWLVRLYKSPFLKYNVFSKTIGLKSFSSSIIVKFSYFVDVLELLLNVSLSILKVG